ncbi:MULTISPECIES: S26 family signal peptidase [unclassified Aureimonas]|uniref:S26 family signal peptidase n=1 Tax=unclassified Aureimonas TaxID=2615206 RepID=UPI0006F8FC62|nr:MULTISPECIES: S26 family signal peptidase [unclassified Aureimonas]KQT62060.1 S26 family signal peptidase [Aureimonas sp. Leaf427]KQT72360.1 S26 family signal peptidase [Aureimonas sp. Leaf460]
MTRFGYVMSAYFATMGIVITSFVAMPLRLLWNASASVPIGFYDIDPPRELAVGDLVAVLPDEALASMMVARGYIAPGVPLLKRIAAVAGQEICRRNRAITIDGAPVGDALERDRKGRDLPTWRGCRRVAPGELFLMNTNVPDSLDGRYFGPLPRAGVVGKARPLWTDEAGDGRFVWHADTSPTPP